MKHALDRAIERFALKLSKKDIQKIVWAIQNDKTSPIYKITRTKCIHAVNYGGRIIYPLYSNTKFPKIHTFLSTGMVLRDSGFKSSELNCKLKKVKKVENAIPKVTDSD